jgi:spore germination protein YaaH
MAKKGGDYPVPSSERSYMDHISLIDEVIPSHAGTLQSHGTWKQDGVLLDNDFARMLPGLSCGAGQSYKPALNPGHGVGSGDLMTVLDNPALQQMAADDLIGLMTDRFDAPWDAVVYDTLKLKSPGYSEKQAGFMALLAEQVHKAGYKFDVGCRGYLEGDTQFPSLDVIAEIADTVYWCCYGWREVSGMESPYWWAESCIQHILAHVPSNRIHLCIPDFATYWPDSENPSKFHIITYAQAMDMVGDAEWIEYMDGMLDRERYAQYDGGCVCIHDADTAYSRLHLVQEYGLDGVMLFSPGMEDLRIWPVLAEWASQQEPTTSGYSRGYSHGVRGMFSIPGL